ncbi:Conserved_hypothetical protein [Hexamita inflata]|uniref:Elongation factor 1 beta central acidic region eukaryote domain-containing protein n=1 Tax=Hexamita inflata TaxID=28002 RepID=A0AA86QRC8_9EUKA|nr:Conserved hypothetical protein [Hexamita inflata]
MTYNLRLLLPSNYRVQPAPLYQRAPSAHTSHPHTVHSDFSAQELVPFWSILRISDEERDFSFSYAQQSTQDFEKYKFELQKATEIQGSFEYSAERFNSVRTDLLHELTLTNQFSPPSQFQLMFVEYKTHLLNMVNQTIQARGVSEQHIYLPYFTNTNGNKFQKILINELPNRMQIISLLQFTRFCVQTDPVALVNAWFQAGQKLKIEDKILQLMFVCGLDFGYQDLASRFQKYINRVCLESFGFNAEQFSGVKVLEFFKFEMRVPAGGADSGLCKIPTFGGKIKNTKKNSTLVTTPIQLQTPKMRPSSSLYKNNAAEEKKLAVEQQIKWLREYYNRKRGPTPICGSLVPEKITFKQKRVYDKMEFTKFSVPTPQKPFQPLYTQVLNYEVKRTVYKETVVKFRPAADQSVKQVVIVKKEPSWKTKRIFISVQATDVLKFKVNPLCYTSEETHEPLFSVDARINSPQSKAQFKSPAKSNSVFSKVFDSKTFMKQASVAEDMTGILNEYDEKNKILKIIVKQDEDDEEKFYVKPEDFQTHTTQVLSYNLSSDDEDVMELNTEQNNQVKTKKKKVKKVIKQEIIESDKQVILGAFSPTKQTENNVEISKQSVPILDSKQSPEPPNKNEVKTNEKMSVKDVLQIKPESIQAKTEAFQTYLNVETNEFDDDIPTNQKTNNNNTINTNDDQKIKVTPHQDNEVNSPIKQQIEKPKEQPTVKAPKEEHKPAKEPETAKPAKDDEFDLFDEQPLEKTTKAKKAKAEEHKAVDEAKTVTSPAKQPGAKTDNLSKIAPVEDKSALSQRPPSAQSKAKDLPAQASKVNNESAHLKKPEDVHPESQQKQKPADDEFDRFSEPKPAESKAPEKKAAEPEKPKEQPAVKAPKEEHKPAKEPETAKPAKDDEFDLFDEQPLEKTTKTKKAKPEEHKAVDEAKTVTSPVKQPGAKTDNLSKIAPVEDKSAVSQRPPSAQSKAKDLPASSSKVNNESVHLKKPEDAHPEIQQKQKPADDEFDRFSEPKPAESKAPEKKPAEPEKPKEQLAVKAPKEEHKPAKEPETAKPAKNDEFDLFDEQPLEKTTKTKKAKTEEHKAVDEAKTVTSPVKQPGAKTDNLSKIAPVEDKSALSQRPPSAQSKAKDLPASSSKVNNESVHLKKPEDAHPEIQQKQKPADDEFDRFSEPKPAESKAPEKKPAEQEKPKEQPAVKAPKEEHKPAKEPETAKPAKDDEFDLFDEQPLEKTTKAKKAKAEEHKAVDEAKTVTSPAKQPGAKTDNLSKIAPVEDKSALFQRPPSAQSKAKDLPAQASKVNNESALLKKPEDVHSESQQKQKPADDEFDRFSEPKPAESKAPEKKPTEPEKPKEQLAVKAPKEEHKPAKEPETAKPAKNDEFDLFDEQPLEKTTKTKKAKPEEHKAVDEAKTVTSPVKQPGAKTDNLSKIAPVEDKSAVSQRPPSAQSKAKDLPAQSSKVNNESVHLKKPEDAHPEIQQKQKPADDEFDRFSEPKPAESKAPEKKPTEPEKPKEQPAVKAPKEEHKTAKEPETAKPAQDDEFDLFDEQPLEKTNKTKKAKTEEHKVVDEAKTVTSPVKQPGTKTDNLSKIAPVEDKSALSQRPPSAQNKAKDLISSPNKVNVDDKSKAKNLSISAEVIQAKTKDMQTYLNIDTNESETPQKPNSPEKPPKQSSAKHSHKKEPQDPSNNLKDQQNELKDQLNEKEPKKDKQQINEQKQLENALYSQKPPINSPSKLEPSPKIPLNLSQKTSENGDSLIQIDADSSPTEEPIQQKTEMEPKTSDKMRPSAAKRKDNETEKKTKKKKKADSDLRSSDTKKNELKKTITSDISDEEILKIGHKK